MDHIKCNLNKNTKYINKYKQIKLKIYSKMLIHKYIFTIVLLSFNI